jgi:acetyltransferase-like isoleucine patch superfamily enzyme
MTQVSAAAIDPSARISGTAAIGSPFRPLLDGRQIQVTRATTIGPRVWIGEFVSVGQGARIDADSIVEDFACIQAEADIGSRVLVSGRSWIGLGASIGNDTVIKGHIGDNSRIGAGCRVAGDLIHRQLDPSIPWDDPAAEEPAPFVEDGAFIGWRATIVGGVKIGEGAYVCAGAVITRDVQAGYIAYGRNQIIHPSEWSGALGKAPFFERAQAEPAPEPDRSMSHASHRTQ